VAQVVLNRLASPALPKSVCAVVFQGSERPTGCQFTFTCDGSLARAPSAEGWAAARAVATQALDGFVEPSVGRATHYHAVYVAPDWSASMVKVAHIGAHIFYAWTGADEMHQSFAAYAGSEAGFRAAWRDDPGSASRPVLGGPGQPQPTPVERPAVRTAVQDAVVVAKVDALARPSLARLPDIVTAPAPPHSLEASRLPVPRDW